MRTYCFTIYERVNGTPLLSGDFPALSNEESAMDQAVLLEQAGPLTFGLRSRGVGKEEGPAIVAGYCRDFLALYAAVAEMGAARPHQSAPQARRDRPHH